MKETKQTKKLLDVPLSFDDYEAVQAFIKNNESSMYGGKNVDGETIMVSLEQGVGMDIRTYQHNGWIHISSYNKYGLKTDDSFDGRHNYYQ